MTLRGIALFDFHSKRIPSASCHLHDRILYFCKTTTFSVYERNEQKETRYIRENMKEVQVTKKLRGNRSKLWHVMERTKMY